MALVPLEILQLLNTAPPLPQSQQAVSPLFQARELRDLVYEELLHECGFEFMHINMLISAKTSKWTSDWYRSIPEWFMVNRQFFREILEQLYWSAEFRPVRLFDHELFTPLPVGFLRLDRAKSVTIMDPYNRPMIPYRLAIG